MRNFAPRIFVVLAALIAAALSQSGESQAAPPQLLIEPVVWQFDRDYPGSLPGDADLPIDTIYVKTHDETYWMSEFDSNPNAITGPDSIRTIISEYAVEGVEVSAWFVPKGHDYARQLEMAKQVIDSGVTALYADLEPFAGFCNLDCLALAENLWIPLRNERPNARLGVIYDPRPWWWSQSATSKWLSVADAALPMCYWEDYTGQVPWMDPAGCISQGRADLKKLAPGRALDYIPMLQGNSTPARMEQALDAAVRAESTRISLWRRGVTPNAVWEMIRGYNEPDGPHCALNLVDGCLIREASQPDVYLIENGAKFHLVNEATFVGMGFDWRDVQVIPLGFTHEIPDAPTDGALLTVFDDSRLYVVYGGARFEIPASDVLPSLGLDPASARLVPTVGAIPTLPGDYTRLKEPSDPTEYVTYGGARIPLDTDGLAALLTIGRAGAGPKLVPDGSLSAIPLAQIKRGDTDCDGNVAVLDAILVLQRTTGVPQPGLCTHIAADVTCDGLVTAADALLILRFASGQPAETSAGCPPIGEATTAALPTPPIGQPAQEPTPASTFAPTESSPASTPFSAASDSPPPVSETPSQAAATASPTGSPPPDGSPSASPSPDADTPTPTLAP